MPSNYNNVDMAYVLPERGINDTQKLDFLQNQRQLEEQRQQRLYEKQQANQWKNLNLIQDDLNFDKYKTGEQAIDGYAQTELQKIQKEALMKHIDDQPAQLEFWLSSQLQPLSQWHTMALGTYKKLDQSLKDLNTQYPNIDYTKARDLALNKFQNDFLDVGEDGSIMRKNTDQIKPSDYASFLQQPQVLGMINNDQSDFAKFFYDIPKNAISDTKYVNKQGHMQEYGWSGMMPQGIGELVTDDNNRPTSIRMRGDIIPSVADAQGNPMRTIPDDIFQQLKGNSKAYVAALGKWNQVRPQIEESYVKQTKQPLTTDVEDKLFKSYLYNEGNRLIAHDLKTEQKQATPKISNVTNINLGNTAINDVYNKVAKNLSDAKQKGSDLQPLTNMDADAREIIMKSINAGRNADNQLPIDNIRLVLANNGDIRAINMKSKRGNIGGGDVVGVFTPQAINLKANIREKPQQKILSGTPNRKVTVNADPLGILK